MTETILDTLGLEQDEVYAKACDEGVKAYFDGVTENPYPYCDLNKQPWPECRQYLGWIDGYHHAKFEKPE